MCCVLDLVLKFELNIVFSKPSTSPPRGFYFHYSSFQNKSIRQLPWEIWPQRYQLPSFCCLTYPRPSCSPNDPGNTGWNPVHLMWFLWQTLECSCLGSGGHRLSTHTRTSWRSLASLPESSGGGGWTCRELSGRCVTETPSEPWGEATAEKLSYNHVNHMVITVTVQEIVVLTCINLRKS